MKAIEPAMPHKKCIDPTAARHFLDHYQNLLKAIPTPPTKGNVVTQLAAARDALHADPALLQSALAHVHNLGRPCADDVLQAVHTLRVNKWIYVSDTTAHSQFLEPKGAAAYATKTLTTPLKEMLGSSGAVLSCGLLVFQGQVICDGLVRFVAWLGPNYRSSFKEELAACRAQGRLYRDRLLPSTPP
jgi:hypothetical protein